MYYYSQKPLDPRLPKPLLHWDKSMTEVHYNAYVNVMREKQKQSQKQNFHYDLAEDFEQKAKINEVNENSSEENNYPSIIDDEVQDNDSTNLPNQKNTNKEKDPSGTSFNFIAKPQPQMPNFNPNNKPQNTYQHFGYSQPPANQFLNQKFFFF